MKDLENYESDWLLCVAGIFGEGKTPSGYEIFWKKYWGRLWRKNTEA